mmetsp:Transcript_4711/g.3365  ORF Transcript_4711/g.3365 Transcript_4711/m.3365 type:complete len:124 (+) Transcript_4711:776-1147(+)
MQDEEVENENLGNEIQLTKIPRVKKRIIDYVLNNYEELFFSSALEVQNSKILEQSSSSILPSEIYQTKLTMEDLLSVPKLLQKVKEELRLSVDRNRDPRGLLKECLEELESKGFINVFGNSEE